MAIPVPALKQPANNACLPTAVLAVLRWHEQRVLFQEVVEWCQTEHHGSVWDLALGGLRAAELIVEEPLGDPMAFLLEALNDVSEPHPVIVTITDPLALSMSDHAVVVTDIEFDPAGEPREVEFMDPLIGSFRREPWHRFLYWWHAADFRAVRVSP